MASSWFKPYDATKDKNSQYYKPPIQPKPPTTNTYKPPTNTPTTTTPKKENTIKRGTADSTMNSSSVGHLDGNQSICGKFDGWYTAAAVELPKLDRVLHQPYVMTAPHFWNS